MLIVQRIVTRWTKQARGGPQATLRSAVPAAFALPPLPDAPLACHDVLAEERTGYEPAVAVDGLSLPAQLNGLRYEVAGSDVRVTRTPVWAAYPNARHPGQVFLLQPGVRARYRANFRFSGYGIEWYYEQWTVNIANAPWERDLFVAGTFELTVDERVSLYGGH
ncbi:hypothetical protein Acor_00890 [Acrocarpospora corrugata]|uniref:Uncharacterized protein n=1 Tax=Acrocarpospora corrugata TaxID=35763 RepID=A0A5M3VUI3_9ACTN|nr:hypothetical protein [Acrocarpospora corrugata]GER98027.1 hypothetical protein Acor_00890 [Acrocarpospora corrugata]